MDIETLSHGSPQTVGVLPDNIAANIKMGAPNATEADIEQAARQVGLGKLLDGGAHASLASGRKRFAPIGW